MSQKPPTPKTAPQSQGGGPGFASGYTDIPGFGLVQKGDYKTYREISGHPTVALAVAIVTAPIIRSTWAWKTTADSKDDTGAPAHIDAGGEKELNKRKLFLQEMFDPHRAQIVKDLLKALTYGWAGFEKVWYTKDGQQGIDHLKPLLWDRTVILADKSGRFNGLQNKIGDTVVKLPKINSHLYTWDAECGNLYGRSRHENIRRWWSRGEEVAERFAQYLKKVSGIVFQLHYPDSGTSKDATGADRPNFWLAGDLLEKVARGENVAIPNKFMAFLGDGGTVPPAVLEKALAAAGKSDWVFSFLDPKGPDLAPGFLETLSYFDKLYFRGWLRPERTALEASRGGIGHGDAEMHSEVGMLDTEAVAADMTHAFNLGVVDDVLVANWGEDARGSVWAEPVPLLDTTEQNAFALLTAALGSQQVGPSVAQKIDWDALLNDIEVPIFAAATPDGVTLVPPSVVAKVRAGVGPNDQPIQINQPPAPQPAPAQGKGTARGRKGKVATMSRAAIRRAAREMRVAGEEAFELANTGD